MRFHVPAKTIAICAAIVLGGFFLGRQGYALNPSASSLPKNLPARLPTIRWSKTFPGTLQTYAALSRQGILVATSNPYVLYALDKNGAILWEHSENDQITSISGDPESGNVALTTTGKLIKFLDGSGSLKWTKELRNPIPSYIPHLLMRNKIIVCYYLNSVICMDTGTGRVLWKRELIGDISIVTLFGESLIIGTGDELLILDLMKGKDLLRTKDCSLIPVDRDPYFEIAGERVYFINRRYQLVSMDRSGNSSTIFPPEGSKEKIELRGFGVTPGGEAVVLQREKPLVALRRDGTVKWEVSLPENASCRVVRAGTRFIVAGTATDEGYGPSFLFFISHDGPIISRKTLEDRDHPNILIDDGMVYVWGRQQIVAIAEPDPAAADQLGEGWKLVKEFDETNFLSLRMPSCTCAFVLAEDTKGSGSFLLSSQDGGISWSRLGVENIERIWAWDEKVFFAEEPYRWIGRSSDSGQTWETLDSRYEDDGPAKMLPLGPDMCLKQRWHDTQMAGRIFFPFGLKPPLTKEGDDAIQNIDWYYQDEHHFYIALWEKDWKLYAKPQDADHPVVNVNLADATAYARRAGKRLPTEAEWEKAARGTDGRKYPWGNRFSESSLHLNTLFYDSTKPDYWFHSGYDTSPVGRFPKGASPFGVLDMAGNIAEWTSDIFSPYPYRGNRRVKDSLLKPEVDLLEEKLPVDSAAIRGDPFFYPAYGENRAEVTQRLVFPPFFRAQWLGFRCVADRKVDGNMVRIPDGSFWMGEGSERHRVYVPTFFIDRCEVTNAQFKKFVDKTGYAPQVICMKRGFAKDPRRLRPKGAGIYSEFYLDEKTGWMAMKGKEPSIAHTGDGGKTYKYFPVPTGEEMRKIFFVNSKVGWLSTYHGIFMTEDGGKTWKRQVFLPGREIVDFAFASDEAGMAILQGGGILRYSQDRP